MRRSIPIATITLIALLCASDVFASHTLLAVQRHALDSWLSTKPSLRQATIADCGECANDIAELRAGAGGVWTPVPDYEPYQAVGDFNNDGKIDFAAMLSDRTKRDVLAIFNGPFGDAIAKPSVIKIGLDLRGGGLFYGPPRPKPYQLIVGAFRHGRSVVAASRFWPCVER